MHCTYIGTRIEQDAASVGGPRESGQIEGHINRLLKITNSLTFNCRFWKFPHACSVFLFRAVEVSQRRTIGIEISGALSCICLRAWKARVWWWLSDSPAPYKHLGWWHDTPVPYEHMRTIGQNLFPRLVIALSTCLYLPTDLIYRWAFNRRHDQDEGVNTEVLRREWYAGFPARSDLFDTIPLFTELRNPATYKTYSVEYVVLAPFHPVSLLVSTFDRKWEPALSHFVDETMRCKVLRNLFIKVCVIPESMPRAQETTALQQSMIFKMVCLVA